MVLCVTCFILLTVRLIFPSFISKGSVVTKDLPLIEKRLDSSYSAYAPRQKNSKSKSRYFAFDPNSVTLQQLLELGLKERTAATFIKFRNKGFVFKQKGDLKKIYGIDEVTYQKLEAFIVIEKVISDVVKINASQQKVQKIIELNNADSISLLEIKGIGPSFAKRIIKYRTLLGGFINTEQLKEVYGLTGEIYETIKPFIKVNPELILKLDLNSDDFKTVNKHPYLSYELTKSIFEKRRKEKINKEILKGLLNDDILYAKIIHYLTFNN